MLVACEESQEVCKAFRARGHEAYSCDIQECSGGHPEWHIQDDVLEVLNPIWDHNAGRDFLDFETMDGKMHGGWDFRWDLIIAHPPCTYLTAASAVRLYNSNHTIKDRERERRGWEAADFFEKIWNADCPKIAIENPVPLRHFRLPGYSQIIEPYEHGDPWKKRTCLWLKGLPLLFPTNMVEPKGLWVGSTCANRDPAIYTKYELHSNRDPKRRAKTFPGIAKAMAEQWG